MDSSAERPSTSDSVVSAPQSTPAIPVTSQSTEPEPITERQLEAAEQAIEACMSAFERSTIRLTRFGVIIGLITLLIFGGQLYEMWCRRLLASAGDCIEPHHEIFCRLLVGSVVVDVEVREF